jgi:hypothetical protein
MNGTHETAHAALERILAGMAGTTPIGSRETLWASSGFSGRRHRFWFEIAEMREPVALACLDSVEFELPGHIVADIALVDRERDPQGCRITIEALTVEDR